MSYLDRAKHYVKAPFRYVKHYFAGERQEEIDGLGDVIVSDETHEEEEDDWLRTSSPAPGGAATPSSAGESLARVAEEEDEMLPDSGVVATVNKEEEEEPLMIRGDRWAVSARDVDLSGDWAIITSDEFKRTYDRYLELLGQPLIVRSVALSIVGLTTEETRQTDRGRSLWIRGKNARGVWERTLQTASGSDEEEAHTTAADYHFRPVRTPIVTIDAERVEAEAWWEDRGTVHRSWIRGVTKYGGGDFEAKRYLEHDGKVLVCETTFHPLDGREKAEVTWRFLKNGETLDDERYKQ